jgi:hypothetical protein
MIDIYSEQYINNFCVEKELFTPGELALLIYSNIENDIRSAELVKTENEQKNMRVMKANKFTNSIPINNKLFIPTNLKSFNLHPNWNVLPAYEKIELNYNKVDQKILIYNYVENKFIIGKINELQSLLQEVFNCD